MQNVAKRFLLASIATVCFLGAGLEANAATVIYSFTGAWDSYTENGSLFPSQSVGDTFSGTFTYDDSTPNSGGSPDYYVYAPTGMITASVGGGTFANTPTPYYQNIITTSLPSYTNPVWQLTSYNCNSATCGTTGDSGGSFNGSPLYYLYNILTLQGDASADTGGAIGPLSLASYLYGQFYLQAGFEYDPRTGTWGSEVYAQGHLTSLDRVSDVPLPAALPLFAAGLSAMGFLGWRKKRKTLATTARVRKSYNRLILTSLLSIGLFSGVGLRSAAASPIDVSFVVSGSSGDWSYDFSVTNNLGGTNQIYAFNIVLPTATITGSPTLWVPTVGSNQWCYVSCYSPFSDLPPGQTLSGFIAHDTSVAALNSISWIIAAIGGYYDGPAGTFGNTRYNPTFEGVASLSSVPLPAALPLYAAGLGIFGYLARRKNKQKAVLRVST